MPHGLMLGAHERGDIVVGWLVRVLMIMSIIGVTLIDAISVVKAHYGAQGDADLAAKQASVAFAVHHDKREAYDAAAAFVIDNDELVDKRTFRVDATGAVRLTLTRTATTVVLEHLPPLRKYGVVTSVGTADAPAAP